MSSIFTIKLANLSWYPIKLANLSWYPIKLANLPPFQDRDESGTLILVSSDGTQQPPIQFPPGGHLMQFLSCLESALTALGGKLEPSVKQRLQQQQLQEVQQLQQQLCTQHSSDSILSFSARRILPLSLVRKKKVNKTGTKS